MMTRETLYDAITEVNDKLIVEAMETKPAKSKVHWLKFGSIAAAAALVAGLGAGVFSGKIPWLPIGGNAAGSGHGDSSIFISYAGPVFPLTTVEGGEGLTADRAITYDFQDWMSYRGQPYYGLPTTDSYTLTNPTGEDRDVTLLYPFVASLHGMGLYSPSLTLNGVELDAVLHAGQYAGGFGNGIFADQPGSSNLSRPKSWEDYKALLSDGSYQLSALGDWPDLSGVPVTVYEITNPWVEPGAGNRGDGSYSPHIHASAEYDFSETTVLSYGFNSYCHYPDGGMTRHGFSVPQPPAPESSVDLGFYEKERAEVHYVIVVGEPVARFELLGTSDGAPDSTNYLAWGVEIGADLRQYETDLESALRTVAEQMYETRSWNGTYGTANTPGFEMYFGMMKDCLLSYGLLSDDPADRYHTGSLEDLDYVGMDRVFYLESQITIPAGGSVTVEAGFLKEGSFDYACTNSKNKNVYGYDLVTRLGTNLDFTAQTATAINTEDVEIVRQNFGFDWANGVNTVTLDPAEEHYYLEVRRSKAAR